MSTYYLDTSAVLKRVIVERESPALRTFLRTAYGDGHLLTSSAIAWVETWRSLRRAGTPDLDGVANVALSGIAALPITDLQLQRARRVGEQHLRSLDALHLAAALDVGADVLVTYNQRLGAAATTVGITTLAPS